MRGSALGILAATAVLAVVAVAFVDRQSIEQIDETTRSHGGDGVPPYSDEEKERIATDLAPRRFATDLGVLLTVATPGVGLAALMRGGRALRRGRWPGPGVAALVVSLPVMVLCLARLAHRLVTNEGDPIAHEARDRFLRTAMLVCKADVLGANLGAWIVLAIARRWRFCPDPLDWLGLTVGFGWIGLN
jgi:hypothetical protein